MGRPRKTDRITDDYGDDVIDEDRPSSNRKRRAEVEEDREMFEQEGLMDDLVLPTHIPREDWPDGKALRWVAIEVAGAVANANWSMKTAAHWTPVQRGQYPRIDKRFPAVPLPGAQADTVNIIFGGLCLCERDIRLEQRAARRQQNETKEALRTVESYVEGGTAEVPRYSNSGKLQVEVARHPAQFKE